VQWHRARQLFARQAIHPAQHAGSVLELYPEKPRIDFFDAATWAVFQKIAWYGHDPDGRYARLDDSAGLPGVAMSERVDRDDAIVNRPCATFERKIGKRLALRD